MRAGKAADEQEVLEDIAISYGSYGRRRSIRSPTEVCSDVVDQCVDVAARF